MKKVKIKCKTDHGSSTDRMSGGSGPLEREVQPCQPLSLATAAFTNLKVSEAFIAHCKTLL